MLSRREYLLIRPWQERRYHYHRKKVLTALPAIDTSSPPHRHHVCCKLKKLQKESERCARIIEDNFILLQHLKTIRSTSRIDNTWVEEPPNFLGKVGIYVQYPTTPKTPASKSLVPGFEKLTSRKDKCVGCNPVLLQPKEEDEIRIPWEPSRPRITLKEEDILEPVSKYLWRCDEDRPEFRGKVWRKPSIDRSKSARPKSTKRHKSLPSVKKGNISVTKDGFTVSLKLPDDPNEDSNVEIIKTEFSECKSFPRFKSAKSSKRHSVP